MFAFETTSADNLCLPEQTNAKFLERTKGGRLYFTDFGFATHSKPNIDLEYSSLSAAFHSVSEPKWWSQAREGGAWSQFCFALFDDPQKRDLEMKPRSQWKVCRKNVKY